MALHLIRELCLLSKIWGSLHIEFVVVSRILNIWRRMSMPYCVIEEISVGSIFVDVHSVGIFASAAWIWTCIQITHLILALGFIVTTAIYQLSTVMGWPKLEICTWEFFTKCCFLHFASWDAIEIRFLSFFMRFTILYWWFNSDETIFPGFSCLTLVIINIACF